MLEDRTPIVETYLQNVTQTHSSEPVPKDDRYFLVEWISPNRSIGKTT